MLALSDGCLAAGDRESRSSYFGDAARQSYPQGNSYLGDAGSYSGDANTSRPPYSGDAS